MKLLLIEDNPSDVRLIQETLNKFERFVFEITNVESLKEALKLLNKRCFDVILLDLGLPDSQGLATFEKIKLYAPELPIVILSGLEDESLALQAIQEGAQDYIEKNSLDRRLLVRLLQYAIERKEAGKALEESEARLIRAEEVAFSGNVTVDITNLDIPHRWSPGLYKILGVKQDEIKPSSEAYLKFIHPDDRDKTSSILQESLIGKKNSEIEYRIILKDGEERWIYTKIVIIRDTNGKSLKMIATMQDITERKKNEEKLRRSETLFRNLFDNAALGIVICRLIRAYL